MFYKDERLALFIDGSNLYAAARSLGFDIDYKLLRQEFMRRGKLVRAFYYTALLENDEYSPIRPLVDWLHYNGYTMVTKPAKEYTDSQGRRKVKGNMDIELTVDAMELAPRIDHIVLFSGDGDFRPLVESLQRQGVRVSGRFYFARWISASVQSNAASALIWSWISITRAGHVLLIKASTAMISSSLRIPS